MFKKYKFLVEKGISEMISAKIGDKVLVYGGNNFPNGTPPEGKKKLYKEMYLFDSEFNIIKQRDGMLEANAGITVEDGERLWYFLNSKIYLLELDDNDIKESEYMSFDSDLEVKYACKYKEKLYFGSKGLYCLDLRDKSIIKLAEFPSTSRNQPVFTRYEKYLYIFGGASNICHLDAYKYDLEENVWTRLEDIPVSFTGSASEMYDEHRLLITGGFNKEVFDDAVKKLANLDYKREYFKKERSEFNWNKNYYLYDFRTEKFAKLEEDFNSATCGSGLIKIGKYFYLIGGEEKPGFRIGYIFRGEIKLEE